MLAFPGLRQVFMLNNTSAMVSRAVRSDLSLLLPPGWVRAREQPMEGYIKSYVQASWAPVLDDKRGAAFNVVLRRRNLLSAFYSALENACSMQRGWKVPNPALRATLRRIVLENVVPASCRFWMTTQRLRCPLGAPPRSWSIGCPSCSKDRKRSLSFFVSEILNT